MHLGLSEQAIAHLIARPWMQTSGNDAQRSVIRTQLEDFRMDCDSIEPVAHVPHDAPADLVDEVGAIRRPNLSGAATVHWSESAGKVPTNPVAMI
ncbi:hypothetical protein NUM3379_22380 [Kineococcus sp. NUM-3379]